MSSSFSLFYIFSALSILSSFMVILSRNPVYSVFFLILSFFNVSSLLFLLRLEFLPIAFIVVYVGAIAVLFLFVMMMLNIKLAELKADNFQYLFVVGIFAFIFILELFLLIRSEFVPLDARTRSDILLLSDLVTPTSLSQFVIWYDVAHNMRAIAQIMFTEHFYPFIISGYILLLAMIGAIVLTLHKTFIARQQQIYAQVLRDFEKAIVNYS
jgi:NADH-quinone oxidoreductase subunit J